MKHTHLLSGVALAAAFATPASAQLLSHKDLSMATALTIATTAIETCKGNGYRVSATVVGRSGEIVVQLRGDDTGPHTIENCQKKAYTSRTFRISSGEFPCSASRTTRPPAPSFLTNIVAAQGALPIKIGDETIGAIGVSGAPGGDKDEGLLGRPVSTRSPTS
jgi:uncharacterized protein GlcG (DUF336 family)